jgi:hypothetical protein
MGIQKIRALKLVSFLFVFFSIFSINNNKAYAGDIEITVIDADLDIPLEGARIISWDGSQIICDSGGRAVITVPDDRSVIIQIQYTGYETGRISVQPGTSSYRAALKLGGILEERELVIEAPRPGSSETVSGRSVAISGRELARSAERGIVEDVMNAVKLLPGVGYVGGYMAMPSVRGGEPSDITAVFDGFYVERPYHWGGAFSIFDPKMVDSAQLSHGVFSARYGHTISGLLDIHAKQPSHDTAEVDLAISTSAANLNLSFPTGRRNTVSGGGVSLMGRVSYWDPFVETAKLFFEEVRYVSTAPYIRSAALGLSHNFSTDLNVTVNGFFGGDGVGVHYDEEDSGSSYRADFLWDNKIGFLTSGLSYSPQNNLLIKGRLGAGILQSDLNAETYSENRKVSPVKVDQRDTFYSDRTVNFQGRFDLDRDMGRGFVLSVGVEERYSRWNRDQQFTRTDRSEWKNSILNHGIASALYTILEYKTEDQRFGMELGLRGEHYLLTGDGFTVKGIPLANPRVNFDFGVLEDAGPVDRLTLTIGTGLFSSINSSLQNVSSENNIGEYQNIQNRSWTSVGGTRIDFPGFTFTLEGYFKYVFNRAYTENDYEDLDSGIAERETNYYFDGKGIIWGFDCMLQKFYSRHWDGWISYSYINSKYKDPQSQGLSRNRGGWYYPSFHRFHTLNIILNWKPVKAVQLTTRFSLASGIPIPETVDIIPDPNVPGSPPPYIRIREYADNSRAGFVIPLDIKLSLFKFNKKGKVSREVYFSFENLLSLVYKAEGPKDFDRNTGRETPGNSIASYDLPIPLVSFGIKWSY